MPMVVRMQQSSYFGTSSNSMGSCSETKVKCHHNIDSRLRIVKNGSNCRKKFYGCSLWLVSRNFFFVLVEIMASLSAFVLIWESFRFSLQIQLQIFFDLG